MELHRLFAQQAVAGRAVLLVFDEHVAAAMRTTNNKWHGRIAARRARY
jgi:hypothetical protein